MTARFVKSMSYTAVAGIAALGWSTLPVTAVSADEVAPFVETTWQETKGQHSKSVHTNSESQDPELVEARAQGVFSTHVEAVEPRGGAPFSTHVEAIDPDASAAEWIELVQRQREQGGQ